MKRILPLNRGQRSLPKKAFAVMKFALLLILFNAYKAQAQSPQITGTITGETDQPLAGVTVKVKGTNNGTYTDSKGSFKINVDDKDVLVISYVGYNDIEMPVNGQRQINIKLTLSTKQLDQVVVIGYGTQRKRDITSAISTVNTNDIKSRPVINTAEILAGKSPGVQVVQPSGRPGSDFSVRIRGIASPNGNEPLYVIDGVMAYDTKGLDPTQIESISILKDASAAGIYGAAGSTNGVVLITTKKGSKGKVQTEINAYAGVQRIVKTLDVLNSAQLASLLVEEKRNAGDNTFTVSDTLLPVNNNWQDIIYRDAPVTGINAGFSGGSDRGTYYFGVSYLNQNGIVLNSNYKRYSVDLNIDQNMNTWLAVGSHVGYNRTYSQDVSDNSRVNQGGVVLTSLSTPPFVPQYNADGTFGLNPFQAWENPLATVLGPWNQTVGNNILGDAHVEVKLPLNIKYRSQFGVTMSNNTYDYFLDPFTTQYGRSKHGIGQNNTGETFRWIWDNTVTFDHRYGNHAINVVIGTSASDQNENYTYEYGENFPGSSTRTLNFASDNKSLSTTKQSWSLVSYFARINYAYSGKYLLSASIRSDGSSRFGADHRWGYFPTLSGAWRISNEDFMNDVDFINDLKIRAGWGITGNIPPSYYPGVSKLSGGYNYSFGDNNYSGVAPSQEIGNSNLKWEQGRQTNVGFDITVLNNRITLSADYYLKKTKDLIYQQNVPMTTGLGYRFNNVNGIVQNSGFEFSLSGQVFKSGNFGWTSTLNMSFNKNVVKDLDSNNIIYAGGIPERDNVTIVKNGLPIGAFWGYVSEGVDPQTGNIKFRDLNNDGVIDPDNDRTYIGNPLPKFTFGFVNEFTYRDFGLNVLIDGTYGNKVFDATRIETEGMFQVNNALTTVLNRWEKPGDITNIPRAVFGDPAPENSQPNSSISSRFIEDGSFLRFRDITVFYNLKDEWAKSLYLNKVRLYVTLQNMLIITNYKGYQPEVNRDNLSSISQGIDYGTYPQAKTITVGLNLNF